MHKVERQIKLVALLLETERPLPFDAIRDHLEGAYDQDPDSAKRMFERDKDDLRDLGIPIELAPVDVWESEEGYRIPPDRYYLPELSFTAEEGSALLVAASVPDEADRAVQGIRKLVSGTEASVLPGAAPHVVAGDEEAVLVPIATAMTERRSVRFEYRTSAGRMAVREVDPFGLVARKGRWYLVGQDRHLGQIRAFRLSRITSDVTTGGEALPRPQGFRAADHVEGPWEASETDERIILAVEDRVAWLLVRSIRDAAELGRQPDGRIEVSIPSTPGAIDRILGFGSDVEVLKPEGVRRSVVERLKRTLASV